MAVIVATKSGSVRVAFNHDRAEYSGLKRRLTEANIIDIDNKILATGLARCGNKDRFARTDGRAYSFLRAIGRGLRFKTISDDFAVALIENAGKLVRLVDLETQKRATAELTQTFESFGGFKAAIALSAVLAERERAEEARKAAKKAYADQQREQGQSRRKSN